MSGYFPVGYCHASYDITGPSMSRYFLIILRGCLWMLYRDIMGMCLPYMTQLVCIWIIIILTSQGHIWVLSHDITWPCLDITVTSQGFVCTLSYDVTWLCLDFFMRSCTVLDVGTSDWYNNESDFIILQIISCAGNLAKYEELQEFWKQQVC